MCPMFGDNLAVLGVYGRNGVSVLAMRAGVLLVLTSLTPQPYNTCTDCRMSEAVSKKKLIYTDILLQAWKKLKERVAGVFFLSMHCTTESF